MTKKKIPFFNYPQLYLADKKKLSEIIESICSQGKFILQDELLQFEASLAQYVGSKYAIGCGNCTDGLRIILEASGVVSGKEIIFCSHTFVATASAIQAAGAIPVPVECDASLTIDPQSLEAAISKNTIGVMPTQLNGRVADMDKVKEICEKHGLHLFEDAAQALGAKYKGQGAGTFGQAAAFSFYPAKSLGCFGDGGAIVTDDDELYQKMKLMRDHGRAENGEVVCWGHNSRLDNLQAAILDYKLGEFDDVVKRRREIASLYQEGLSEIEQLTLPPAPSSSSDYFDTFQNYEICSERRDALKSHLAEQGIGTIVQWGGKAVHQFKALGFTQSLPFTEKLFAECLLLPMNPSLLDEDVEYVIESIRKFFA